MVDSMKGAVIADGRVSYSDFRMPTPGHGHDLVRVLAAALTNLDVITAEGRHYFSPAITPAVAGNECVGTLPSGERRYFPVTSLVPPFGSFAEWTLASAQKSLPIPDDVPDDLAASLGNAGLAGWLPLSWRGQLRQGESVLILGATGVTGLIAVAAARLLGAGRVVAAGRSKAGLAKALALGADAVVRLDSVDDLLSSFREALNGEADIVLDYLNGPATADALTSMAVGGRLIQIGSALGAVIAIPAALARKQLISVMGFGYYHASLDEQAKAYTSLCDAAMRNQLDVERQVLSLSRVADAWGMQKQQFMGRLVLVPDRVHTSRSRGQPAVP